MKATPTIESHVQHGNEQSRPGPRHPRLKADEETLREDTRIGLRAARGLVPIAEAAQRAGLNRSTVYELYLGNGNAED
jgi:hypothetical protein